MYLLLSIPFGLLVLVIGATYLRFLGQLPRKYRHRFILSGGLYVGGALGVELPLGYWTDLHGDENFSYALVDWVEETLGICGMAVFAWTLASFATSSDEGLRILPAQTE